MKTKLLICSMIMLMQTLIGFGQTKTWDFGNDDTTWPLSGGIGTSPMVVDNLGLYPIPTNSNFGAVTSSNATFDDGFTAPRRFQLNGGGGVTPPTYMPTQRYLFFDVDGPCTVKVWFKTGSNGTQRTVYVTDGSNLIGEGSSNDGTNADLVIFTANYTSPTGGRLYVYGSSACNLYKMEVTGANVSATLSNASFTSEITTKVYTNENQLYITNIETENTIWVYSLSGQLVKSLTTTKDTTMTLLKGFYIVNVVSSEGNKKSFKLII